MELSGTLENSKFSKKGYSRFPALATTSATARATAARTGTSKKKYVFLSKNNNFPRAARFLYICVVPCTTTTWNCLNARFMEGVNKWRRISLSLRSKLECGPQESNSREICLHLTFSANWNTVNSFWDGLLGDLQYASVLERCPSYIESHIKELKKGRDQLWVSVLKRCPFYRGVR